jgi:hypothetical protein
LSNTIVLIPDSKLMKKLLCCLLLLSPLFSNAQQIQIPNNHENFFIQVMLDECTEDVYQLLESELESNPYVRIVRLDRYSKGLLIGTQNLSNLDRATFESWLSAHQDKIICYYQGIHGVDLMYAFNEQFCSQVSSN